jgi:hypothetical protein
VKTVKTGTLFGYKVDSFKPNNRTTSPFTLYELSHRDDLLELLDTDRKHLEIDISRVYRLLVFEWLRYIQYIKNNYSYLFSLAIRMNPFDPKANAVVKE